MSLAMAEEASPVRRTYTPRSWLKFCRSAAASRVRLDANGGHAIIAVILGSALAKRDHPDRCQASRMKSFERKALDIHKVRE